MVMRGVLGFGLGCLAALGLGCAAHQDQGVQDGTPPGEPVNQVTEPPAPGPQTPTPPSATEYWPTADAWETTTPEAAGWNATKLEEAFAYAASKASTALIILVDGRIVGERYWQGWDQHSNGPIFSAAKSITAILVGMAQERGLLSIEDTVQKHLGVGWSKAPAETEAKITIRHLLTMTSGLDDTLTPVGEPGAKWYYSTEAYVKTHYVLDKVTGDRDKFTEDNLFAKIGTQDTHWRPRIQNHLGQTIDASARDMARFGLMMLRGGRWSTGEVLADKTFLGAATATSQELNPAYGYFFWLNGKSSYVLPFESAGTGTLFPNAPADLYAALGKGDKKIYVVPSKKWVVVRQGEAAGGAQLASSSFDNDLWTKLVAAAPQ